MGDFELFHHYQSSFILGLIVYNIINIFFSRDLLKRFGITKVARKDFYECGFRPQTQKTVQIPLQFILITLFFLVYDIELIFLFPLSTGLAYYDFYFFIFLFFYFFIFLLSLGIDYERHALF
jgi:NADH:ubiquinone oxidoreductase subunit 3 (subunit A)